MDKLRITGGSKLHGEVMISGAKNAALPILCASLLTSEPLRLSNVPRLNDISTTLKLLGQMGVKSARDENGVMTVQADQVTSLEAPYEMVKTMRASILVLDRLWRALGRHA